jgi:hypothetical protein
VSAKEKLLERVTQLTEAGAEGMLLEEVVEKPRSETAPLVEGWGKTLAGEPMAEVAAAVRRSRESH